jgi:hypothetical protein
MTSTLQDEGSTATKTAPSDGDTAIPIVFEAQASHGNESVKEYELPEIPPRSNLHQILGAGLCTFGALLWAFMVAGEFTTAGFIGEGIAVICVIVATCGTTVVAIRSCRSDSFRKLNLGAHIVLTVLVALMLSIITVVALDAGLRAKQGNLDIPVTLFMLLLSGVAFAWGRRLLGWNLRQSSLRKLRLALYGIALTLSFGAAIHVIAAN